LGKDFCPGDGIELGYMYYIDIIKEKREKSVKKKHSRYIYYVPTDSMFGSSAINNCTHACHRTILVYT